MLDSTVIDENAVASRMLSGVRPKEAQPTGGDTAEAEFLDGS